MPPVALVLVLAAAGIHAGWNLLLHGTEDRVPTLAVAGLTAGVGLLPATLLAPPWRVLPLIALSAAVETVYALCLAAAYRRGALAVAYPIGRGTAPLLVTLGAWAVLAERPALLALLGALSLALGLVLVATAGRKSGQSAAVGFALLTGVAIASYSLVDARAVRQVNPAGYLGVVLLLQGTLLAALSGGNRARLRRSLSPGVRVAAGMVGGYLLVLFAFQRAAAGRVETLREVSVLIGIVLARNVPARRVWLGAALVVAGAVLTAW